MLYVLSELRIKRLRHSVESDAPHYGLKRGLGRLCEERRVKVVGNYLAARFRDALYRVTISVILERGIVRQCVRVVAPLQRVDL